MLVNAILTYTFLIDIKLFICKLYDCLLSSDCQLHFLHNGIYFLFRYRILTLQKPFAAIKSTTKMKMVFSLKPMLSNQTQ